MLLIFFGCSLLSPNVLGLCEVADFKAQMFNLAQMFIRIPNAEFSTEPAILQNPCYLLPLFRVCLSVHFYCCFVRWLGSSFAFFSVGFVRWKKCKCATKSVGCLFTNLYMLSNLVNINCPSQV